MNSVELSVSSEPSFNIDTNQFRQRYYTNRKKILLQILIIGAFILLFLTLIITFVYLYKKETLCIVNINLTTSIQIQSQTSTSIRTSTFDQLLTTGFYFYFFIN
jgi:hypothetical protein